MGEDSKIEWCDHTFNPWVGCTKISPACDHCYAESWARRSGSPDLWQGERRRTSASNWQQPLKWNKQAAANGTRPRVFCASLADVFDNQVPTRWRDDLWFLIRQTPHLDWLLLTKRPQNIVKMLPDPATGIDPWGDGWPNVWLGTTVEDQKRADERLPHLLNTPAAVRFVSAEPLLGPLLLDNRNLIADETYWNYLTGERGATVSHRAVRPERTGKINWVICGGESGPGARPMHPAWARSLRDQCKAAGVPFHFKQWGEYIPVFTDNSGAELGCFEDGCGDLPVFDTGRRYKVETFDGQEMWRVGKKNAGRMLDGVTHDEFPAGAA